jgi:DNA-binding transcriptional MerR regulator
MTTNRYTPSEAAARSGFSLDTLRFYEREGVLPRIERTSGGRRTYTDSDLQTLEFLRCLRDTGMSVSQLRRFGELSRDEQTIPERLALLEAHAASIQINIDGLSSMKARVDEKSGWYRSQLG